MERFKKPLSIILVFALVYQLVFPVVAFALTGGPSNPEVESFEPIGTTEMVDLFTGDFSYNIPLFDIGGYPMNLSYHSGITMDQEASWVGLGWNINPGTINRDLRGLPDDFKGDTVSKSFNIKPNTTWGVNASISAKLGGFPVVPTFGMGVFKNNYNGMGMSLSLSGGLSVGAAAKGEKTGNLGITLNTQEGVSVNASAAFKKESSKDNLSTSIGSGVNSRSGLKALSISASVESSKKTPILREINKDKTKSEKSSINSYAQSGFSTGSAISFSTQTFNPTITMPMRTVGFSLNGTMGGDLYFFHPNATLTGYYSRQELASKTEALASYGYLHSQEGFENDRALMDFNREKDMPYNPKIENLPIPNFTNDLFSVSGQGIGGQFRPTRGDIGILFDHKATTTSTNGDGGIELGVGGLVHAGYSIEGTSVTTTSGKWDSDNEIKDNINFIKNANADYEPVYFRNVGEKVEINSAFQSQIGGSNPLDITLEGNQSNALRVMRQFTANNSSLASIPVNNAFYKSTRDKRTQVFNALTAVEAKFVGLNKDIVGIQANALGYTLTAEKGGIRRNRNAFPYKANHISEITVTNPEGKRFIYGVPIYNTYQKEVTFAVSHPSSSPSDGQITYVKGTDNSTGNDKGKDNYYSAENTPPYATSFLISGVVSPDYVDLSGNGISDDDLGEAIKFDYSLINPQYHWRTPLDSSKANFNEGTLSNPNDDRANYVYGTKELWYLHAMESKTMYALFVLDTTRKDGRGVRDENGGINNADKQNLLKEIRIYSKYDIIKNGNGAIPIKTIHFVYSYSLCHGVSNFEGTSSGKLTLDSLYFTYANNVGRLNAYAFSYDTHNPNYKLKSYDRWGSYQNNADTAAHVSLNNSDYPYSIQKKALQDLWSSSWHMNKITLPSGGQIKIQYESKDYAYLQNKRAGQMFVISGFAYDISAPVTQKLFNDNGTQNQFLIIDNLPVPLTATSDIKQKEEIRLRYLADISKLYFRFKIDVDHKGSYEYIPGYADIEDYGKISGNKIWIKLANVDCGHSLNANPVAVAAWQFLRLNLPDKAYPSSQNSGSFLSLITSLMSVAGELKDLIGGFESRAISNKYGQSFLKDYSFVRLSNPDFKKLGGGCRVKSVLLNDNWQHIVNSGSSQQDFEYGQEYSYTTKKKVNINGVESEIEISSGVAAYEPGVGGDENSLHQPIVTEIKQALAPNNSMYVETPMGESLYPSPTIGYSKVTVRNLSHSNVQRTGTGYTENEFYTAAEFPTITSYTPVEKRKHAPKRLFKMFAIKSTEYHTASQGYMVEVNDMHGKQKSVKTFNQYGDLIAKTTYHYKVDNENAPVKHLQNSVDVIDPSGVIHNRSVGLDLDMWADMRQEETKVHAGGVNTNSETIYIPPFLILTVPFPVPKYSSEVTRYRSAVVVKYVQRFGLLDRVEKMVDGSTISTDNLLYDSETGNVVMTKTGNEFNDTLYSFTYPAHWAYDGMGPAYKNIGFSFLADSVTNGTIYSAVSYSNYLVEGDEVLITTEGVLPFKAWVAKIANNIKLISGNGLPFKSNLIPGLSDKISIKVTRSGRRNMAALPIGTMAGVQSPPVSLVNNGSMLVNNSSRYKITQISATEYSDQWKADCDKTNFQICDTTSSCSACLQEFMLALSNFVYNQGDNHLTFLFTSQPDTFSLADIYAWACLNDTACTFDSTCFNQNGLAMKDVPFTPLTTNVETTHYRAKIGDCYINMYLYDASGALTTGDFSKVKPNPAMDTFDGTCANYSYVTDAAQHSRVMSAPRIKICSDCDFTKVTCRDTCLRMGRDVTVNPFVRNMKDNWHAKRTWAYNNHRIASADSTLAATRIKNDGYFAGNNNPFWLHLSGKLKKNTSMNSYWVRSDEVTRINRRGTDVESKNALDLYSAILYGYNETMAKAVSSNAKVKQIANDNFEDYGYRNTLVTPCQEEHWNYKNAVDSPNVRLSSLEAHSGYQSLRLGTNQSASVQRDIVTDIDTPILKENGNYYAMANGCMSKFSPDSGKYILSAWVKQEGSCTTNSYTNNEIIITLHDSVSNTNIVKHITPSGIIIEGWQRLFDEFTMPKNISLVTVQLKNNSSTAAIYFDDVRIHPQYSSMKTHVYDPVSLRLMATLDENNYATFYEYDDSGKLIRVKKETERGIMTVQESRTMLHGQ